MTDLVVDVVQLRRISANLATAPDQVSFDGSQIGDLSASLGSPLVAAAVVTATSEQRVRAEAVALSLRDVAAAPSDAASSFEAADRRLSQDVC
ncbi:hypothetical protein [Microbacterium ulmi]|uniref:Uncharacterized protein n=1 Tax=Microbacterium ulmi TaxID=179095 RepID=A0A7Y2Q052_9MICO|nr:hypothetical protein [Microbacterium ulmi]NII69390.1 hypothetical protein [Microbacterium ulmi]NNH03998.1 hypothetical protein [Microbacterium ulmi]